jgi:hypothetical protein
MGYAGIGMSVHAEGAASCKPYAGLRKETEGNQQASSQGLLLTLHLTDFSRLTFSSAHELGSSLYNILHLGPANRKEFSLPFKRSALPVRWPLARQFGASGT